MCCYEVRHHRYVVVATRQLALLTDVVDADQQRAHVPIGLFEQATKEKGTSFHLR